MSGKRVDCIECGKTVDDEQAIYSSGGVKNDGLESLLIDGEAISIDELFGFDDGPYCSLDCSMKDSE